MLTLLFTIMMFVVFGKLIGLAFRATWGITKILVTVVLLPVVLICMVAGGLIFFTLPILAIVGLVTLFSYKA
ncbi:MAG: hypothetical protein PHT28_02795 [Dehalococcoidales bacterium]|nr:hypothetical protein [Dehalococcoidales bacterium]